MTAESPAGGRKAGSGVEPVTSSSDAARRSPLKAIRAHCVWCCNGNTREVARCPAQHCPLRLLRSGHRPKAPDIEQTADVALYPYERPATASELHATSGAVLKAIRRQCIDCSGGSLAKVQTCRCTT